jgi:hypothetical protein
MPWWGRWPTQPACFEAESAKRKLGSDGPSSWPAELRSAANGKGLDLDVAGAVGKGTKIQVWDCDGAPQQQWRAEEIGGAWRLRNRRFECLDADRNGQYHDGKRVQAWDCHVQGNQLWTAEW